MAKKRDTKTEAQRKYSSELSAIDTAFQALEGKGLIDTFLNFRDPATKTSGFKLFQQGLRFLIRHPIASLNLFLLATNRKTPFKYDFFAEVAKLDSFWKVMKAKKDNIPQMVKLIKITDEPSKDPDRASKLLEIWSRDPVLQKKMRDNKGVIGIYAAGLIESKGDVKVRADSFGISPDLAEHAVVFLNHPARIHEINQILTEAKQIRERKIDFKSDEIARAKEELSEKKFGEFNTLISDGKINEARALLANEIVAKAASKTVALLNEPDIKSYLEDHAMSLETVATKLFNGPLKETVSALGVREELLGSMHIILQNMDKVYEIDGHINSDPPDILKAVGVILDMITEDKEFREFASKNGTFITKTFESILSPRADTRARMRELGLDWKMFEIMPALLDNLDKINAIYKMAEAKDDLGVGAAVFDMIDKDERLKTFFSKNTLLIETMIEKIITGNEELSASIRKKDPGLALIKPFTKHGLKNPAEMSCVFATKSTAAITKKITWLVVKSPELRKAVAKRIMGPIKPNAYLKKVITTYRGENPGKFEDLYRLLKESSKLYRDDFQRRIDNRKFEGQTFDTISLNKFRIEEYSFKKSKFIKCSFDGSVLRNVSFEKTKFQEVIFSGATIDGKTLKTLLPAIKVANAKGAKITLDNVKFVGDLSGLDFSAISLKWADFTEVTGFADVNLKGCKLMSAKITDHQLAQAIHIDKAEGLADGRLKRIRSDHRIMILKRFAEVLIDTAIAKGDVSAEMHQDTKTIQLVNDFSKAILTNDKLSQEIKDEFFSTLERDFETMKAGFKHKLKFGKKHHMDTAVSYLDKAVSSSPDELLEMLIINKFADRIATELGVLDKHTFFIRRQLGELTKKFMEANPSFKIYDLQTDSEKIQKLREDIKATYKSLGKLTEKKTKAVDSKIQTVFEANLGSRALTAEEDKIASVIAHGVVLQIFAKDKPGSDKHEPDQELVYQSLRTAMLSLKSNGVKSFKALIPEEGESIAGRVVRKKIGVDHKSSTGLSGVYLGAVGRGLKGRKISAKKISGVESLVESIMKDYISEHATTETEIPVR